MQVQGMYAYTTLVQIEQQAQEAVDSGLNRDGCLNLQTLGKCVKKVKTPGKTQTVCVLLLSFDWTWHSKSEPGLEQRKIQSPLSRCPARLVWTWHLSWCETPSSPVWASLSRDLDLWVPDLTVHPSCSWVFAHSGAWSVDILATGLWNTIQTKNDLFNLESLAEIFQPRTVITDSMP